MRRKSTNPSGEFFRARETYRLTDSNEGLRKGMETYRAESENFGWEKTLHRKTMKVTNATLV